MSMVKIIPPGAQDLGEAPLQLVKIGRDGLRGRDRKDLEKRASWRLAETIDKIALHPGEVLAHNIALGATEHYGANRNFDGFKAAACRKFHDTFVKNARAYRNHSNKNPAKSYGVVKYSEFNEPMQRVELLIAYNGTKEAAERNGGLVADEELNLLHAGKDLATSMACRVGYDLHEACGNKAKNRSEYCLGADEGGHCKRGGCRNRLGFVHEDGFVNYVDNPHPKFFDISRVFRGADRTSWTNGVVKAASGLPLGGAALAELLGVEAPATLYDDDVGASRLEKLALELAQLETVFARGRADVRDWALSPEFSKEASWARPSGTAAEALAALAMFKIALPLRPWLEAVHGGSPTWTDAEAIQASLPGIYGRMLADGTIKAAASRLPVLRPGGPPALVQWAADRAEAAALTATAVDRRIKLASLRDYAPPRPPSVGVKRASAAEETLARGHAFYKLAFLTAMQDRVADFPALCWLCVRQNYI